MKTVQEWVDWWQANTDRDERDFVEAVRTEFAKEAVAKLHEEANGSNDGFAAACWHGAADIVEALAKENP